MKPLEIPRVYTTRAIECPDCLRGIREHKHTTIGTYYCGHCHKLIVDAAHSFCGFCGEKIDWEALT